jgi:hypothetical protein
MKTYKFVLTVTEGYDEFWEQLYGKSGCDEVTQLIRDALFDVLPEATVKLVEYNDSSKE